MSALSEAREDLRALLDGSTGITAQIFKTIPEAVTPPCALVGPGVSYITGNFAGMNFGESLVNLKVTLVAAGGTNDTAADELDELIVETVKVIEGSNAFLFDTVEEPGRITLNGQVFLGCVVNISRISRL